MCSPGSRAASGDNTRVAKMRAICGDDFRLYSGEDGMARDYVLQGGDGPARGAAEAQVYPSSGVAVILALGQRRPCPRHRQ